MGVDFACILDLPSPDVANLPPHVLAIPAKLDALRGRLEAVWGVPAEATLLPGHRVEWAADLVPASWTAWSAPTAADDELSLELHGPFDFGGEVTRHALTLQHVSRWKWFLGDDGGHRARMANSCRLIAEAVGVRRLIYLSDLGVEMLAEERAGGFDDMTRRLAERWGPPAAWDTVYPVGERYWERYFIEVLGDGDGGE